MLHEPVRRQETFLRQSLRRCGRNTRSQYGAIRRWTSNATRASIRFLEWSWERVLSEVDQSAEHPVLCIMILPVIVGTMAICGILMPAVADNSINLSFARVGLSILAVLFSFLVGLVFHVIGAISVVAGLVLFLPFLITGAVIVVAQVVIRCALPVGAVLCTVWCALDVLGQFLLLIPLFGMFITTRVIQLWRGIFFTCPSRRCSYRGLPAYVCPHCHAINERLWPSLYGVFWHECIACGRRLPTLDLLGRKHLKRCCGHKDCRMPLLGRHAGRFPERLVAVVGGPDSGKTCYLHMAVHQIVQGNGQPMRIHGSIDDPQQEKAFQDAWDRLHAGAVPGKTKDVTHAYILHTRVQDKRCQLYLYDAPGEEFSSLSSMSRQQYFPLIEGFILLVDPTSFATVAGSAASARTQLATVVSSTLGTAVAGMTPGAGGKFPQRVAVVISKADTAAVRKWLGDIGHAPVSGEACRQAICAWGGEHSVRLIEQRFAEVGYFACSALGRPVATNSKEPFSGHGLLEPLAWILKGQPAVWMMPNSHLPGSSKVITGDTLEGGTTVQHDGRSWHMRGGL